MTTAPVGDYNARRITAIAAAVQAYIDDEKRREHDHSNGISAWRSEHLPESQDTFAERRRSWIGRN